MSFKLDEWKYFFFFFWKYFLKRTSLTQGNAEGCLSLKVLSTMVYHLPLLLKPPWDQKLQANLPNWVFHKSLWLPQLYHSSFNVRHSEAAPSWETADSLSATLTPGSNFFLFLHCGWILSRNPPLWVYLSLGTVRLEDGLINEHAADGGGKIRLPLQFFFCT